eukprot:scaffold98595_cov22-Tisochrysis_lutea.AAC.1
MKQLQENEAFAENLRAKRAAATSGRLVQPTLSGAIVTAPSLRDVPPQEQAEDACSFADASDVASITSSEDSLGGRRSAPIWRCFKAHPTKERHFICQELIKDVGSGTEKICGAVLGARAGPTPLWNHHLGKHKDRYQILKGFLDDATLDEGVTNKDSLQTTISALQFSQKRKEEVDLACARWL